MSDLWGGRVSDAVITKKSGLLDLLEPGDSVIADRGFDVGDMLHQRGITQYPSFLGAARTTNKS